MYNYHNIYPKYDYNPENGILIRRLSNPIPQEAIYLTLGELVVKGEEAIKVADMLNSTSFRILRLLSKERLDVSEIAKRLGLSESYMSGQIRFLEESKLIRVDYEQGKRGIRKMCKLVVKRITLVIEL